MKAFFLTSLTMVAFAANSVLNRLALADGAMGPASFAAVRLASGALVLVILVWLTQGRFRVAGKRRAAGVVSLALYMLGFSFAYVTLDAGVGALILFGGVQITMFIGAVILKEPIGPARLTGALIAFSGLVFLMWPTSAGAPVWTGAALMSSAALGWGIYSLIGRGGGNPLASTAANFLLAAPVAMIVLALRPDGMSPSGLIYAVVSGVVTSGLGYALWYTVLPKLAASVAAVAQLTVPVIALAGGSLFLGETLTLKFAVAAALVLGGVTLSLVPNRRFLPTDRS